MFCFKSSALISKVLFEITLRREWENFSCSNTSKNAVRYIAIKNDFCSFREVALRRSIRRFRRAESGAKVKTFFETTKSFRKIFSKTFSEPFSLHRRRDVIVKADAKVSQISETPKIYGTFFKTFSEPVVAPEHCFLSRSGCKDKACGMLFPNISATFF